MQTLKGVQVKGEGKMKHDMKYKSLNQPLHTTTIAINTNVKLEIDSVALEPSLSFSNKCTFMQTDDHERI